MVDEHFANTDAWTTMDHQSHWLTYCLAENATLLPGGGLRLTSTGVLNEDGKYPGAQLYSNTKYQYGYFEIKCKQPAGTSGIWTCFWMWPDFTWGWQVDEIDIMEYFAADPGREQVGEWIAGPGSKNNSYIDLSWLPDPTMYHTYACRWRPGEIAYFVDGVLCVTHNFAFLDEPERMILWHGCGDPAGNPAPAEAFPAHFDIEYVKVWQETS